MLPHITPPAPKPPVLTHVTPPAPKTPTPPHATPKVQKTPTPPHCTPPAPKTPVPHPVPPAPKTPSQPHAQETPEKPGACGPGGTDSHHDDSHSAGHGSCGTPAAAPSSGHVTGASNHLASADPTSDSTHHGTDADVSSSTQGHPTSTAQAASNDLFHFGDFNSGHSAAGASTCGSWTDIVDSEHGASTHVASAGAGWTDTIDSHGPTGTSAHGGTDPAHDEHPIVHPDSTHTAHNADHIDKSHG